MAVPAITAWRKSGPVALRMVLRSARRARLGLLSTMNELSASVRIHTSAYARTLERVLRVCDVVFSDCLANTCTCKNGVPELAGPHCPVNGAASCLACNTGWTISHDRTKCIGACARSFVHENTVHTKKLTLCKLSFCDYTANKCACKNGVAQSGSGCAVDGAAKCAFCSTGWTINHDKTECICTCAHFCKGKYNLLRACSCA